MQEPKIGLKADPKPMPKGKSSTNLGAIVSVELKERLKSYAESKHWSMSQTVAILLKEALDRAEAEAKGKGEEK